MIEEWCSLLGRTSTWWKSIEKKRSKQKQEAGDDTSDDPRLNRHLNLLLPKDPNASDSDRREGFEQRAERLTRAPEPVRASPCHQI
jgi:hypothetical protein